MTNYVKIYGSQLLRSTVWVSTDKETKLVWITLLSIADRHGLALTSIPGLAKDACIDIDECERALKTLCSPDPYSRTKKYEGRRLEVIDGGFLLLNYKKYREIRTETQVKEAERKAAWRAKQTAKKGAGRVPDVPSSPTVSRATPTPTPTPSLSEKEGTGNSKTSEPIAKMDLVPTRDRSIIAKSLVDSLEQIGQIEIVKKELLGWQIRAVFSYWVKKMGKDNTRTKLSLGRWARLKKYINLYDIETCLYAIDGALIHPHHNQDDGKTFHEFAEIFMNKPEGPDRVEKISEYARKKDRHPKHRLLEKYPELEGHVE